MKKTLALTVVLAGLAALAWAGLPLRAQETGRAQIEDLAWMEGHWHGQGLGGTVAGAQEDCNQERCC